MMINKRECRAAGLDPAEVEKIARGLSRYAKQAENLGICIFGGSGSGDLRFDDRKGGQLILATLDGDYDGGDGANSPDDDGLLRGEYS